MKFESGDSVKFGKKWCKEHNSEHLVGKTIMMTPQWFEEDNGLYCYESECPGILAEGSDYPESIYHLFGNNFEWFMDCELVKGTEEDKKRYESIRQERFKAKSEYYEKMAHDFENIDSTEPHSEAEVAPSLKYPTGDD